MMRFTLVLFLCWLVIACAHNRVPSIPVEFGDRQTLFFTGKGAAAGIMMDAYLGGAGVAIGIAIDEGIAKDISAAILNADPEFDMRVLVREQLARSDVTVTKNWQTVVVEKYGFKAVDGDFVAPVLALRVNCKMGTEMLRFDGVSINAEKAELDAIKKDGLIGVGLLQFAVEKTMQIKSSALLCEGKT